MNPDNVVSMLLETLAPGVPLQPPTDAPRTSAPALSYGRHRGPARPRARVAAVAVTLYRRPEDGQWLIPLTLRPHSLQHHAGQVCLPGGRLEPGEDPFQAAMREFREELGVEPRVMHYCGELATQYVYASHNLVHPVVAVIDHPSGPWQADPVEVAEVITLPLTALVQQRDPHELKVKREVRHQGITVDEFVFRAPAFRCGEHTIWGATAMILEQLAQILHPNVTIVSTCRD
jgi:8-oxo-dGTP pyrophosphatase MutT (NUDIX family)